MPNQERLFIMGCIQLCFNGPNLAMFIHLNGFILSKTLLLQPPYDPMNKQILQNTQRQKQLLEE